MQVKRYMSLGSNCTIAGALRELKIRSVGVLDWALVKDFHSVVQLFSNTPNLYSFNEELSIQFPHQDITDIKIYNELSKRLYNTLSADKNICFVYLVERNSVFEFMYKEIQNFRRYRSNPLILILPVTYEIEQYAKLKKLGVYCYYDYDCVFDASGDFNAKCKNYAKEFTSIISNYEKIKGEICENC